MQHRSDELVRGMVRPEHNVNDPLGGVASPNYQFLQGADATTSSAVTIKTVSDLSHGKGMDDGRENIQNVQPWEPSGFLGNALRSLSHRVRTFLPRRERLLPFESGFTSDDAIFLYSNARTNRNLVRIPARKQQLQSSNALTRVFRQWRGVSAPAERIDQHASLTTERLADRHSGLKVFAPTPLLCAPSVPRNAHSEQRNGSSVLIASMVKSVWSSTFDIAYWLVGGDLLTEREHITSSVAHAEGEASPGESGSTTLPQEAVMFTISNNYSVVMENSAESETDVPGNESESESGYAQTAASLGALVTAGREWAAEAQEYVARRVLKLAAGTDQQEEKQAGVETGVRQQDTSESLPLLLPVAKEVVTSALLLSSPTAGGAVADGDYPAANITSSAVSAEEASFRIALMQQVYRIFQGSKEQQQPARVDISKVRAAQEDPAISSSVHSLVAFEEALAPPIGSATQGLVQSGLSLLPFVGGTETNAVALSDAPPTSLSLVASGRPEELLRTANASARSHTAELLALEPATNDSAMRSIAANQSLISSIADAPRRFWFRSRVVPPSAAPSATKANSALAAAQEVTRLPPPPLAPSLEPIDDEELLSLLPSRADFAHILAHRAELAIAAALAVNSELAASEFLTQIGLNPVLARLLSASRSSSAHASRVDALRALNTLVRYHQASAAELAGHAGMVQVLCEVIEQPLRVLEAWSPIKSAAHKARLLQAQHEAVSLVHRLVRSSDGAVNLLRNNARLRMLLAIVANAETAQAALDPSANSGTSSWAALAVKELERVQQDQLQQQQQVDAAKARKNMKTYKVRKQSNVTAVGEYADLRAGQMARVASWSLGGMPWQPRAPGQKGLRILSLDGGGTRGVLSIAFLKEILRRVNRGREPHQLFDIICGTSTGGIIATLLGAQRASLAESEVLYDAFIDKIFTQRSNLRLVTEQAAYDGRDWEKILYDMCGDQLLLDSNQHDCARVFCVSTKVNVNPPMPNLWRNYNYPPGVNPRYPGASRVNTFTAIRATTAAPTFFTPVRWENGLYCDGALVANNPTAIALQEAKILYPNVPVELVVSIGTGYTTTHSTMHSMGWDVLVNQLIASSTDTEDVHALLRDFLPPDKYFRFNPVLPDTMRIDEKNKTVLTGLKGLARTHINALEAGPEGRHFAQLIKTLRGPK